MASHRLALLVTLGLLAACAADRERIDPARLRVVDLTHPFDSETLYWPTAPSSFELRRLAWGTMPGGYFYAANALATPEHGGTHLDAPLHFGEGRPAVAEIPAARLVAEAVVIDVTEQAASQAEYALQPSDVLAFEARHGPVARNSIVLLHTGWDRFWPDRKAYLGDDTPGDASNLRFPSYGAEAARLLVEARGVAGLGVDTASIDVGSSQEFQVHRIAAKNDVFGLENLTGLAALPPRGALLVALPMKIAGGSGAPLRAVALLPVADGDQP